MEPQEEIMESATSPVPTKKNVRRLLNFYEALKEVADGKMIFRIDWQSEGVWGLIYNETLALKKSDGKYYSWVVSLGDMLAEDWVVLE